MLQDKQYFPALDYLRIVLSVIVAMGHAGIPLWSESGNFAVQVFFAMSGWLIGGILLNSDRADLPRFYYNRAARIWIPYFVAIVLLALASLTKEQITPKWIEVFFYNITFVYNLFGPPQLALYQQMMPLQGTGNHFWSICSEEQFYLIAPCLIVMLGGFFRSIWLWIVICLITWMSDYWGYFCSISLGVLAAMVNQRFGLWQTAQWAKIGLGLASIGLLVLMLAGQLDYRIGAPLDSLAIVLLLTQPGEQTKFGSFAGGVSYPMYLNHWIGVFIANAVFAKLAMKDTIYSQLSGVMISLAISAVLYLAIDVNIRKRRNRYFTPGRGKALAAFGFGLVAVGFVVGLTVY